MFGFIQMCYECFPKFWNEFKLYKWFVVLSWFRLFEVNEWSRSQCVSTFFISLIALCSNTSLFGSYVFGAYIMIWQHTYIYILYRPPKRVESITCNFNKISLSHKTSALETLDASTWCIRASHKRGFHLTMPLLLIGFHHYIIQHHSVLWLK